MVRATYFARTALGLALAMGVAAGGLSTPAMAKDKKEEAKPAKITLSKGFMPSYSAARAALDAAAKRQNVIDARAAVTAAENAHRSASGKKARDDAKAKYDASVAALGGLLTAETALIDQAFATATTPDDKFVAGQLALSLGQLSFGKPMQRRGLQAMVDSGKASPADTAKFNYYIGGISFDMREFPAARTALSEAIAGGYTEGGVDGLLADSYINDNQPAEGLKVLEAAVTKRGSAAPEDWIRKGIVVAYKAKLPAQGISFATKLVDLYPSKDNWALAIAVVRDMSNFQAQEQIDLMRLMQRTDSWSEARDFIEYIQAADPRRLPGEALKIVNLGLAAGKLQASDPFVADAKSIATGRIAQDKSSIPALERDARAPNANAATVMAAGDVFLSYDDPAKAEAMFALALTKPGVDAPRVLTRLGIAQVDQGRYADAQATFAKVTGIRAPIASLWSAYAKSKASAATPAK
jgi:tetratricopeptide (TPR) repeat protein